MSNVAVMPLFAAIGEKQIQIENLNRAYDDLLQVLAKVVLGEYDPSRVLVNLTDRTWQVSPPGQRPSTPCTINGLPICVTAPETPVKATSGLRAGDEIDLRTFDSAVLSETTPLSGHARVNPNLQVCELPHDAEVPEQGDPDPVPEEEPRACVKPVGVSRLGKAVR